jgi:N-acetylmuramoyl-L-alanine amidase
VADVNSDANLSDKTQNAGETAGTEATDSTEGSNENVTEESVAANSGSSGEGSETIADGSNAESAAGTVADNVSSQQVESVTESAAENATEAPTQPKKTVICLDPGHGGESQGTHYTYDGVEIEEKNLNYYIAKRLKVYLEQYDDIEVVIDRGENVDPSFEERIAFAVENNADLIVSLHNNSKSRDDIEPKGCMAITTCSRYQAESAVNDDVYGTSRALALSILSSLKNIGLSITVDWDANKTNGILQRVGAGTYPDGSESDYYGLIRNATSAGIPSVIIEHAFLSNESDYRKFLSSNAKLDSLAKADAAGIVNYLNSR